MSRKPRRPQLTLSIVKPAPGELRLVQELVNTADLRSGSEELTDPRALAAWLVARRLLDAETQLTERDLELAIEVREGLRALAAANNGAALEAGVVERLNRAFGEARLRLVFQAGGRGALVAASRSFADALGHLGAVVVAAQQRGDWRRLKACAQQACRGVFFDSSTNLAGRWCAMRRCGAQASSRAYRDRRGPPPPIRPPGSP